MPSRHVLPFRRPPEDEPEEVTIFTNYVLQDLPPDARGRYDEITTATDAFCHEYVQPLAWEAVVFCRALTVECLQGDCSLDLSRGHAAGWAAGVTHTIAFVNYLCFEFATPYVPVEAIATFLGVSKGQVYTRSRTIRKALDIDQDTIRWILPTKQIGRILDGPDIELLRLRDWPVEDRLRMYEEGTVPWLPLVVPLPWEASGLQPPWDELDDAAELDSDGFAPEELNETLDWLFGEMKDHQEDDDEPESSSDDAVNLPPGFRLHRPNQNPRGD
ncbi:MAG: DUF6398 domain-containing protein, partial [Planctomycetota bacterium]